MAWTQEKVKTAIELWNKGVSAGDIASRLGNPFTRSSVIAKIWRMRRVVPGLRERSADGKALETSITVSKRRKRQKKKPSLAAPKTRSQTRAAAALAVAAFEPTRDISTPTVRSLLDLLDHHCRWPYENPGSAGFGFCGRARLMGLPYCTTHARIAYVEPRGFVSRDMRAPKAAPAERQRDEEKQDA